MPVDGVLIDRFGRPMADRFVAVADDAAPPDGVAALVSLARLTAEPALLDRAAPLGVALPAGAGLDAVVSWLDRLALITVAFPVFRDGRGFTLIRALREAHGYRGEIRATGHVLPDQYVFLVRCGVSSVALPDGADVATWAAALHRQSHPEQPAAERALPLLRRIALPFDAA
jgi:uncharacterized protein (DUF934 family)